MSGAPLKYHRGDERPAWVETVTVNGTADNMSTGYTFTVQLQQGDDTAILTKTTNITGATAGVVTVAWAAGELDLTPGTYKALLTARRTSDSLDWTIRRDLIILGV